MLLKVFHAPVISLFIVTKAVKSASQLTLYTTSEDIPHYEHHETLMNHFAVNLGFFI